MITKPLPRWRSWSFWTRLGMGLVAVLLTVFVSGVYWLKWKARAQREAVAAIKEARGKVEYDWDDPDARANVAFSRPVWTDRFLPWNWSPGA